MVKIKFVEPSSVAEGCGIKNGDVLVKINGNEINDVLDYRFYLAERKIKLELLREGKSFTVKIKKDEYDDIGLGFETPLMDKKHSCTNKCIFCFIDQNPEGMRESIYFKDDDSRLSFIHGNYVTLTNMKECDVQRIIKMRMSPINISIHTTDPDLRVKMMNNRFAGDVLRYLDDFRDAGLSMCGQIVLCRGVNDGAALARTLSDLSEYYPALSSVAIVPAGLTKHRNGLYPLSDFTPEEAALVIDEVEKFANIQLSRFGTRQFFIADELYLKAGRSIPCEEYYEDYPQLDNGVGMLRLFTSEWGLAIEDIADMLKEFSGKRTVTLVTAAAAYDMICTLADRLNSLCDGLDVRVKKIINNFYGESITVTGLLTGRDIYEQLSGTDLGDEVIVPENALRHPEEDFLCGMTLKGLSEKLGVKVSAGSSDGYMLVRMILGLKDDV